MYDNIEQELETLINAKEYFLICINYENDDNRLAFYHYHLDKINARISAIKLMKDSKQ